MIMTYKNNKSCGNTGGRVSITKNNLKILSWNIQSSSTIEGNKFQIKEFQNIISTHDFICLQEIRQDVQLMGFHPECNTRKDKLTGGVGILVKNELLEGVEFIKSVEGSDYLICKLDKVFFRQTNDIYIINTYIRPSNSSSATEFNSGEEAFKKIENIINSLKKKGEVILCGDFNSRIGQKPEIIEHDSKKYVPMPQDYSPDDCTPRYSQDIHTNSNCNHFINLIIHNQLIILNGRTLGDLGGNFTSIQQQGCSVVDYFAVSKFIKQNVNYLKIQEFTEFSDHKPLSLNIICNQLTLNKIESLEEKYNATPTRYIFNDDNKSSFLIAQKNESSLNLLHELTEYLDNFNNENNIDLIQHANEKFSQHIRDLASGCFKQTKNNTKKKQSNNPWFNWQTRLAKRELRKAAKATSDFPTSDFIRKEFYKVKGHYKRLLSKTSSNYFQNLNKDIEDGKVLNWQAFKKLKSQKNSKIKYDSHDMDKFENFFKNLYSDNHSTLNKNTKNNFLKQADILNTISTHPEVINKKITMEEISSVIKSLKSGKASSLDMVSN